MIKIRCFYLKDISNKFHTFNSACLILLKVLTATKQISIVSMKSTIVKNSRDKLQKSVNIQSNHTQNNTFLVYRCFCERKKLGRKCRLFKFFGTYTVST